MGGSPTPGWGAPAGGGEPQQERLLRCNVLAIIRFGVSGDPVIPLQFGHCALCGTIDLYSKRSVVCVCVVCVCVCVVCVCVCVCVCVRERERVLYYAPSILFKG